MLAGRSCESTIVEKCSRIIRLGLIGFHRGATTHEMPIAVGFVDAADARPELAIPEPWSGKRRLFPAIWAIPFRRRHDCSCMRGILQHIVRSRLASIDDLLNLGTDE